MTANFLSIGLDKLNNLDGDVAVATSAPTADFYFQVLTTTYKPTKEQCIMALRQFERYLISNGVPAGNVGVDLPVL
jgi:hypothetical protein